MSLAQREKLTAVPHFSSRYIPNPTPAKVSVVVPAYCEAENISVLYEELQQVFAQSGDSWELIIVDDGSVDGTWNEICRLHGRDSRVKGLRLCRNFGHQYALLSGLAHASGFAVVTMDADLQHPPATIPELLKQWSNGNKIVHTIRRDPQNISWFKKLTSRIFYRIFGLLSGIEMSEGTSDFRLLDKQVVQDLLHFKESGLFLRGLVQWVGYPNTSVEYQCRERHSGETKYSLPKMLKFAWSGITSFSIIPLRIAIVIGIMSSVLAFYELGEALYVKLVLHRAVLGWASLFGFMSLFFGILFILLGVLGEYIARILEEVRGRPRYIVSEVIGLGLTSATDVSEAGSAILPEIV